MKQDAKNVSLGHKTGAGEIEMKNVVVSIVDRNNQTVKLVEDCSFVAERGKFTALVGPSGCGKTTLMISLLDIFSQTPELSSLRELTSRDQVGIDC